MTSPLPVMLTPALAPPLPLTHPANSILGPAQKSLPLCSFPPQTLHVMPQSGLLQHLVCSAQVPAVYQDGL